MKNDKKKVVVISNDQFPIPAVLGGAVENLVTTLMRCNEEKPQYIFEVFSPKMHGNEEEVGKYKYTNIIFINTNFISYKIKRIIRYVLKRITGVSIENQYLSEVKRKLINIGHVDFILIENAPEYLNHIHKNSNTKIALHLHNDYISNDIKYNNKLYSKSDIIITVSNYLKKKIESHTSVDLNISVLYNGIDLDRFGRIEDDNTKCKLRAKYNYVEEDIVIIYAGRIQEDKGVKVLVEAFVELQAKYKIKLLIAGGTAFANSIDTKFLKELKNYIKNKNADVTFTGYLNYEEMHRVYSIGDFSVLPSLCEEAFGLTVLESMASGLPVIISNAGGMPEVINSESGIMVERGDQMKNQLKAAMEELIQNQKLRQKMSTEARKRAANFSKEKYYNKFSSIMKL